MPQTVTLLRQDVEVLASAGLAFATMLRLRQTLVDRGDEDPMPPATVQIDGSPPQEIAFGHEQLAEIEQAVKRTRRALGWSHAPDVR